MSASDSSPSAVTGPSTSLLAPHRLEGYFTLVTELEQELVSLETNPNISYEALARRGFGTLRKVLRFESGSPLWREVRSQVENSLCIEPPVSRIIDYLSDLLTPEGEIRVSQDQELDRKRAMVSMQEFIRGI